MTTRAAPREIVWIHREETECNGHVLANGHSARPRIIPTRRIAVW